jgi:hypothetical protein
MDVMPYKQIMLIVFERMLHQETWGGGVGGGRFEEPDYRIWVRHECIETISIIRLLLPIIGHNWFLDYVHKN